MAITTRFAIGQIWSDNRTQPQTVIAITAHPEFPVVTQDNRGDVCCYRSNGTYETGGGKFDLKTLISDVQVAA